MLHFNNAAPACPHHARPHHTDTRSIFIYFPSASASQYQPAQSLTPRTQGAHGCWMDRDAVRAAKAFAKETMADQIVEMPGPSFQLSHRTGCSYTDVILTSLLHGSQMDAAIMVHFVINPDGRVSSTATTCPCPQFSLDWSCCHVNALVAAFVGAPDGYLVLQLPSSPPERVLPPPVETEQEVITIDNDDDDDDGGEASAARPAKMTTVAAAEPSTFDLLRSFSHPTDGGRGRGRGGGARGRGALTTAKRPRDDGEPAAAATSSSAVDGPAAKRSRGRPRGRRNT